MTENTNFVIECVTNGIFHLLNSEDTTNEQLCKTFMDVQYVLDINHIYQQTFISQYTNIKKYYKHSGTIIHILCYYPKLTAELLKICLDFPNIDINKIADENFPYNYLQILCAHERLCNELLPVLLSYPLLKVNQITNIGNTILHFLCKNTNVSAYTHKMVLKKISDLNLLNLINATITHEIHVPYNPMDNLILYNKVSYIVLDHASLNRIQRIYIMIIHGAYYKLHWHINLMYQDLQDIYDKEQMIVHNKHYIDYITILYTYFTHFIANELIYAECGATIIKDIIIYLFRHSLQLMMLNPMLKQLIYMEIVFLHEDIQND